MSLGCKISIEKFLRKERSKETKEIIDIWDSNYYKCWAELKTLSGKKFAEQNSTQYKRVDSFKVRYFNKTKVLLEDNLENFRLIYKGKIYKISYAYDIKDEHMYIDLECELYE